ncbi:MAG TPA: hypothetical protein VF641_02755, partial [Methylobacterium sp.]
TLEGVHSVLERLVIRLGTLEGEGLPASDARFAPDALADRLLSSTSVPKPRGPSAARRPEAPRTPGSTATVDIARAKEELLEPGAGRPVRDRMSIAETPEPAGSANADIKTSFIAAARRAAQAAQAEASAKPATGEAKGAAATPGPAGAGRVARLRAEIDRRRRPLLLGLAAIVLALGTLQAVSLWMPGPDASSTPQVAGGSSMPAPAGNGDASARTARDASPSASATSPAVPAPSDPQTTQALPAPTVAPAESEAGSSRPVPPSQRGGVPRVTSAATLASDLAAVPTGLGKLRQSALDGDGAAIYELAARQADGRGMPRDLALAAKLYEKLAGAGYAPAQYKLAGQYEKGSGVTRDLAQAKTWYGRAADQGHARAMHNLAVLHAENPSVTGKPDFATAAQWFRRGAEHGIRDSQYNLAVLYARGLGLQQDLVQSYAWFSAAATQGDEDAAKKRDDVAGKLNPKDLAAAKALTANFKAKVAEPAVNEPPAPAPAAGAMTLLGSPLPTTPNPIGRRG